jgi:uncharacterized membrane protein
MSCSCGNVTISSFFGVGGCNILTEGVFVTTCLAMRECLTSCVRYDKLLFYERQTVTGRNVRVVKFLVFMIGILVHLATLFQRSFDLRSSIWLKGNAKFYTRRKQQLNYFCVVYFSRLVDIQYISTLCVYFILFYLFFTVSVGCVCVLLDSV